MNYEQKYKEALSRAKVVNPGTKDYNIVTAIFPELKESEDELIRKELISFLEGLKDTTLASKFIDWVKKQHVPTSFYDIPKPKTEFNVGDLVVDCISSKFSNGRVVAEITHIDANRIWLDTNTWITSNRIKHFSSDDLNRLTSKDMLYVLTKLLNRTK